MNSLNDNQSKAKLDLQHKTKLANAIPLSVFLVGVSIAGWLFESELEASYSNTIAINLLPDNKENNEDETVESFSQVSDKTNDAASLLYEAVIAKQQDGAGLDYEHLLSQLTNVEKLKAKALTVKQLKSNRYYQQALDVLTGMTQSQLESQQLIFSKAYVLAKLGHGQAAINNYQHLLTLQNNHQAANINLGLLLLEEGEIEKAEKIFIRGVTQTAGLKKAKNYFGLGDVYYQQKNYPLALSNYSKAIEYYPAYAPSWRRLGKVARKMQNHELASDSYQKSITLDKDNVKSRVEYADYLCSQLDYEQAIEQLKNAKRIDRESFSIRLKLAFSFARAGKPINARKQLNLAKNNIQKNVEKKQSEAMQKYLGGKYLESTIILKSNLTKGINNEFEYFLLALNFTSLKKFKLAKDYIGKIATDSSYYYQARYLLAKSLLDDEQFVDSLELFRIITANIASNYKVLNQASIAEQMSQNYNMAIELVNRALVLRTDRKLLLRKADLYWLLGKQSEAIAQLEKIVVDYPSYLRAIYHLSSYNHKLGKQSEAIAGFEELLQKRPSYGDAQYQLAVILFEKRDFGLSQALLADYLLKKPDSKRTRLLYARTFCETGQSQACKEQLELVLKLAPDYQQALDLHDSLE